MTCFGEHPVNTRWYPIYGISAPTQSGPDLTTYWGGSEHLPAEGLWALEGLPLVAPLYSKGKGYIPLHRCSGAGQGPPKSGSILGQYWVPNSSWYPILGC